MNAESNARNNMIALCLGLLIWGNTVATILVAMFPEMAPYSNASAPIALVHVLLVMRRCLIEFLAKN